MNPQKFTQYLAEQDIVLTEKQLDQFAIYYQTLIEWNEKVNLTAITDQDEVYLKHFYDSLTPSFYYPFQKQLHICDVGSGAGFPSIPLKICFPQIHVSIVDSLQKRIDFLQTLVDRLQLNNVHLFHSRAEDFGQNKTYRESYDVVLARAVARMSVLSEYCLPLVKKDGMFIAMKGARGEAELSDANKAITVLGGKIDKLKTFNLPKENSERSLIFIEKVKNTPKKYPRKAGVPNKQPIT